MPARLPNHSRGEAVDSPLLGLQQSDRRRSLPVLHRPTRSDKSLCVVEESNNILPVEKTHAFNGRYHVLMGSLSPLKGVTPDQLAITSLLQTAAIRTVEEVIVATNPNVEGETTALYLSRLIKPLGFA